MLPKGFPSFLVATFMVLILLQNVQESQGLTCLVGRNELYDQVVCDHDHNVRRVCKERKEKLACAYDRLDVNGKWKACGCANDHGCDEDGNLCFCLTDLCNYAGARYTVLGSASAKSTKPFKVFLVLAVTMTLTLTSAYLFIH